MDEWVDVSMGGLLDYRLESRIDGWMDGWMDGLLDYRLESRMDGWMFRRMGCSIIDSSPGWMDGCFDGWVARLSTLLSIVCLSVSLRPAAQLSDPSSYDCNTIDYPSVLNQPGRCFVEVFRRSNPSFARRAAGDTAVENAEEK